MIHRFFRQSWLSFKGSQAALGFEEFVLLQLSYPLLTLMFFVTLAAYSFNTTDLTRWVVGNSFLLCINATLHSIGKSFTEERIYGRLRSMIVSPTNIMAIALQKVVFPMIVGVVTVIVGFIISSLIFNVNFSDINFLLMLSTIIISMFATVGLGTLFSTIALLSDSVSLILNTIRYVLVIFSGANFPIQQLPAWGQAISGMLPLTRGIKAANLLFVEFDIWDFLSLIIGEFMIGILYFTAAFLIIKYVERAAIKNATLEIF